MSRKRNEYRHSRGEHALLVPASTVARKLGLDTSTIRGWVDHGEIRGTVKRGRYYVYQSELRRLVDAAQEPFNIPTPEV